MVRKNWTALVGLLFVLTVGPASAADKPLKVFILAGQSNMQGHAAISTFDSLADDPKTALLLKEMRDKDGKPKVFERVWITSVGCQGDAYTDLKEQKGQLTAGYGAFGVEGKRIGPEFTFGLTMEKLLNEPILIIKTSWGGRSVHTDFRPPSAGPYVFNEFELNKFKKRGDDIAKIKADKIKDTGRYYGEMIKHVKFVLKDIKRVVPTYDEKQGYELAGFAWFQGFNDYVGHDTYDQHMKPGGYDQYSTNLGHFIRDVRKDLGVPKLPFTIGVMGIDGEKGETKTPMKHFRAAPRKVLEAEDFKDNVLAVETWPYWDDDLDALSERRSKVWNKLDQDFKKTPMMKQDEKQAIRLKALETEFKPEDLKRLERGVSNGGYHYLGAAKILAPIGKALAEANFELMKGGKQPEKPTIRKAEMAGYLLVPHEKVDKSFNAGFSTYVAAWPLLRNYPGSDFQSGLFGTWMFAQHDGPKPEKMYSDIEGGLGWWRDTRFATETPKFIMGGVALNFSAWANGPGAGVGRDWKKPRGHYAIAQLSPWVLWPPDGLNLKQGTNGELFGYGYLPLPLTQANKTTGNNCWTLFLNTGNFKGPVAYFQPNFWSAPTIDKPDLNGMFLDTKPSEPNKAVQMETQHIPAFIATDAKGDSYARIAPVQFPGTPDAETPLVHRMTAYNKAALWDNVQAWFDGGKEASGVIDPVHSATHTFKGGGGATWQIYSEGSAKDKKVNVAWNSFANPTAVNGTTFGYKWTKEFVKTDAGVVTLPEYYRLDKDKKDKDHWVVVNAKDVPEETGLTRKEFARVPGADRKPYVTPAEAESSWKKPGPVAGPFEAKLGDGSTVTYSWHRFADQPALLNAGMTEAEREALQKRIVLLHKAWTKDREYLPAPTLGKLADLDPALLVTPPKGFEVGYVPVVTRQGIKE